MKVLLQQVVNYKVYENGIIGPTTVSDYEIFEKKKDALTNVWMDALSKFQGYPQSNS